MPGSLSSASPSDVEPLFTARSYVSLEVTVWNDSSTLTSCPDAVTVTESCTASRLSAKSATATPSAVTVTALLMSDSACICASTV